MTPSVIARRTAQAQERIIAHAMLIAAGNASLDTSGLAVTHRDPRVQSMLRLESLGDFLAKLSEIALLERQPKAAKRGVKDETDS